MLIDPSFDTVLSLPIKRIARTEPKDSLWALYIPGHTSIHKAKNCFSMLHIEVVFLVYL